MTLRNTIIRIATRRSAIWLLGVVAAIGALCSCADDGEEAVPSTVAAGGDVSVIFSIGGMAGGAGTRSASATRADSNASAGTRAESNTTTGAGDDDNLNENRITRLDLYVFSGTTDEAECEKHVYYHNEQGSKFSYLDDNGEEAEDTVTTMGKWTETGLYWPNIKGKTVYIVANDSLGGSRSISKLADLKSCTISHTSFSPADKQKAFLMDGKAEDLTLNTNVLKTTNNGTATYTICQNVTSTTTTETKDGETITTTSYSSGGGVELKRALAKIRLTVLAADSTNITTNEKVIYHFVHYAANGSLIADGTDITTTTEVKEKVMRGSEAVTQAKDDGTIKRAVFYTYPNNWLVEENVDELQKLMREDETKLIKADRQTYILLCAPFTTTTGDNGETTSETKNYWYKVPVNYRLQEDNDDANAEFDYSLYKTQRNYIYDVTVTIDRAGGTYGDPVTLENLQYQAQAWDDKSSEVSFY